MPPIGTSSLSLPLITVLSFTVAFSISALRATALEYDSHTDFQALCCLKFHLTSSSAPLASWKNDSSQYCSWSGVTCSKGHASRVVALDLESFGLDGQIPSCIANLTFLTRIHLPNNQLAGSIPPELGQLHRLQYINLSSNSLTGNIPPSLGSSSPLRSVSLADNGLTGPIPSLLANCSSLQLLALTNNNLIGEIPPALFRITSLRKLLLGRNSFIGSIPAFSNIDSPLQHLVLQSNNLTGTLPFTLGNFSSLHRLLLGDNFLQGSIPSSIGEIPNLEILDMSYNFLSASVPASLYNMSSLIYLGMAVNNLVGEIPDTIGYTLPMIQTLVLQANQFQGQIPTSLANATNLQVINLRHNALRGIVPSFGTLSSLTDLNLGKNFLEAGDWSFLSALTNCTELVKLQLDENTLQGDLPTSVAKLSSSLQVLLLNANKISGTIPQDIGHLTNLTLLHMEDNLLIGNLPESIGNLPDLFVLNLANNKFGGHIPLSFGNLSKLSELYLQKNNFSGPIPKGLGNCKKLTTLNLSCNDFNGNIPKELFSLSSLSEGFDLSYNQLSGQIPLEIGGLANLGPLNISHNQLSGQIPSTLGECVHLESLHMEGNLLQGRIPESLANLRGIIVMDLSENNLSGEIPTFFEEFGSMKVLNLSFNNLEGPVPTTGIFQNQSDVFIQGNDRLCANNPVLQLPFCNAHSSKHGNISNILKIMGFTALSLVLLFCFVFILLKKRKKVRKDALPSYKELDKLTYYDLMKATNGFSLTNFVGSGKFGSVYKGRIQSEDQIVAIKVLKLDQLGAPESFVVECEALRNIRHRNLIRVITACSTIDRIRHEFKAIVLEYMVNGNLESWLHPTTSHQHPTRRPLSLGSRISILVDIAAGMDYLHNQCMPPIAHCDLKPSNVLLDDIMGARVGDFGLAKFLPTYTDSRVDDSASLVGPRGSIGYIAPEYGFGSKISKEGDVYSFGVIILEMLTGKRPTDEMFKDGMNLQKFVERAFPEHICQILDPRIMTNYGDEDEHTKSQESPPVDGMMSCIRKLLEVGLLCSMETPTGRPAMHEVHRELVTIKEACSTLPG